MQNVGQSNIKAIVTSYFVQRNRRNLYANADAGIIHYALF